ncbi:MAG: tRNA pseudouridine(55) synthase TruB [Spirochaetota bacterium]
MNHAGVLFIDKQPGCTSFQSLGSIKRQFGRKVGHAGTLDKFASGLLIALVGPFTKLNPYFSGLDKVYTAEFTFGTQTDTLDPEGRITGQGDVPALPDIESCCSYFIGEQQQIPPQYSAVHVQGKRSYKAARAGEHLEIPPRTITIHDIECVSWNPPKLVLRISCSKGTYIRSLARDIGASLNTCAYVSALRRERIGPFDLTLAKPPEQLSNADLRQDRELLSQVAAFSFCTVDEQHTGDILNGKLPQPGWCIELSAQPGESRCLIYRENGNLMGLANIQKEVNNRVDFLSYQFVVPQGY